MRDSALLGLEGKALVVGGGSGIGRATSLMWRGPARTWWSGISARERVQRRRRSREVRVKAGTVGGDVTVEKSGGGGQLRRRVPRGPAQRTRQHRRLRRLEDHFRVDDEVWQLDISRNLTQHLYVSRAAGRHMIDHGTKGRLALVASVSGIYGPNHGTYGAAKAGVMDLVRTMSQEWAPTASASTQFAPDCIATPGSGPRTKSKVSTWWNRLVPEVSRSAASASRGDRRGARLPRLGYVHLRHRPDDHRRRWHPCGVPAPEVHHHHVVSRP